MIRLIGNPRTPTRTRRTLVYVYVNVYRFAVYGYVSGPSLRSPEKPIGA